MQTRLVENAGITLDSGIPGGIAPSSNLGGEAERRRYGTVRIESEYNRLSQL